MIREGFLSTSQAVAQHLPYLRRQRGLFRVARRPAMPTWRPLSKPWSRTLRCWTPASLLKDCPLSALHKDLEFSCAKRQARAVAPVSRSSAHLAQIPRSRVRPFCSSPSRGLSRTTPPRLLDIDAPTLRDLVERSGRELAAEIATDVLSLLKMKRSSRSIWRVSVESLGHRVLGVARDARRSRGSCKSKAARDHPLLTFNSLTAARA